MRVRLLAICLVLAAGMATTHWPSTLTATAAPAGGRGECVMAMV